MQYLCMLYEIFCKRCFSVYLKLNIQIEQIIYALQTHTHTHTSTKHRLKLWYTKIVHSHFAGIVQHIRATLPLSSIFFIQHPEAALSNDCLYLVQT